MAHSDGVVGSSTWAPGYPPIFDSVTHIPSPPGYGYSQGDSRSYTPLTACGSLGGQTFAAFKQESISDKTDS